jgi:hypothetical protein
MIMHRKHEMLIVRCRILASHSAALPDDFASVGAETVSY